MKMEVNEDTAVTLDCQFSFLDFIDLCLLPFLLRLIKGTSLQQVTIMLKVWISYNFLALLALTL